MKIMGESMEVQKQQQQQQQEHHLEEGSFTTKRNNRANETNALTWFNLVLITVLVFNTTFTMTLLVKYYYVSIENTLILNQILFSPKPQPRQSMIDDGLSLSSNVEQFGLLRKEPIERNLECPPCPTPEPPTEVIPPNKDPVSVLNTEFGPRATYNCIYSCEVPPIHIATVIIEDHDKEYTGRGKSKQAAKQDAAYRAISESFTHLLEQVIHEEVVYNPECLDDKNSKFLELPSLPKKC